ncbi:lysine--tRNA ligase [Bythopirellula goksoeyrii]|uniref:Lysine--tRNA ligase n=1 Tax=Bythopirellula goksoeyrii TaxID=1400387 RepID=A0A5B9QLF7_9BACT|nr:lysine--tRNA ligase [Bythopirellula goksoeyrii]QEG34903.1 Lysine--tRNA ligase [Bythopirellula goksoeyrii]
MPQLMTNNAENHTDDLSTLESNRREKMARLQELGIDPWGGRFDDRTLVGEIRAAADQIAYQLEDGTTLPLPDFDQQGPDFNFRQWKADQGKGKIIGPQVRAAGRIVLHRDKGKLHFIDIRDMSGQIQLMVGQKQVGDDWKTVELLDLGDIIGVDGQLVRSNTGELSIAAERIHFLTKSIETPPDKHGGLQDVELRQRQRYLDLTYTEGVLDRFLNRTKIVRSIRDTLNGQGFVEVEGPTLHSIAGGAAARPFMTHHNTLDMDLTLRIALELHLKRLMVGGIERVYELGRVYRNEGISPRHNPEFTMLEVYQAFGDYRSMMDLTEACICNAIQATGQSYVLSWGDKSIDFTPPFARRTYAELFEEATGIDTEIPNAEAAIAELAKSLHIETKGRHPDVIKSDVFEAKVEDALVGPVFVMDYPASICPLTKRKRDNPAIAERFELFIHGMEVANAYTELNDPDLQEELFRTQLDGLSEEDSMAKMDTDFVRALRHGMPPAGGLGIGIDRLVMLLTNTQTIRDVILFPLLRPEK